MKFLIEFLENKDIEQTVIFKSINCNINEIKLLQEVTRYYIDGEESTEVISLLKNVFGKKKFAYLKEIDLIRKLLSKGWFVQNEHHALKISEISNLELLSNTISLSKSFLRLLERGTLEVTTLELKPYTEHLEYLKDQFLKIDLYQKIGLLRQNYDDKSAGITRIKERLELIEEQINKKLELTKKEMTVELIFEENELDEKERIIFLTLLKEEYNFDGDFSRDINSIIDLISLDEYDKIRNRNLLEDDSKLIENELIDYDEMFTTFGGISRSFYLREEILKRIMHPDKVQKKEKMKIETILKDQEIFELIVPRYSLDDVILDSSTIEILKSIQKQSDKKVLKKLKEWGIRRSVNIVTKVIFYGVAGTGKTMSAYALSKSLKRKVLNFDCSKILSMYVGESEKNVRSIFDKYNEIAKQVTLKPVLLLNEADQFLSSRVEQTSSGSEKMHNQMQNIFLEQIEKFDGILIATTNFLDGIDKAFSRRFDYKVEFKKPEFKQRLLLWDKFLPKKANYESSFNIDQLASSKLTGAQIELIIKNTALKVALRDNSTFTTNDFKEVIEKEERGSFDKDKVLGFSI